MLTTKQIDEGFDKFNLADWPRAQYEECLASTELKRIFMESFQEIGKMALTGADLSVPVLIILAKMADVAFAAGVKDVECRMLQGIFDIDSDTFNV